jgi:hypothetical protein
MIMNANTNNNVNNQVLVNQNTNNSHTSRGSNKGEGVMNKVTKMLKLKNAVIATAAAVTGLVIAPSHSNAALVTLQNGNSIVKLSTLSTDGQSPDGVYQWTVDGTSVAEQQQFYYRIGNTGPGTDISNLTPSAIVPPVVTLSTTGNGINNYASVSYQGNGFTVNARYELLGGAAGSDFSELLEQMIVTNISTHTLQFHMADYSDLNLSNPAGNDSGSSNANGMMITQTGPNDAISPYTGLEAIAEAGSAPSEFEVGEGGSGAGSLLAGLLNGSGFPLNDNTTESNTDVAYAQEYDQTLGVNGSLVFTVGQIIEPVSIPEPTSSAVLLSAGAIFLARPRRRDEDPDGRTVQVAGA